MRTPAILQPLLGRSPDFSRMQRAVCMGSGSRDEIEKMIIGVRRIREDIHIRLIAQPDCQDLDVEEWIDIREVESSPFGHLRRLMTDCPDLLAFILDGRHAYWRQWLFTTMVCCRSTIVFNENGDGFFLRLRSLNHLYHMLFRKQHGGRRRSLGSGFAESLTRLLGLPLLVLDAIGLQTKRKEVDPAFALPLPGQYDWKQTLVENHVLQAGQPQAEGSSSVPEQSIEAENESPIEFTGERYVPGIDPSLELEHYSRYSFASRFVGDKRVLDAGCGEGYGVSSLARTALEAVGVDISQEAMDKARNRYGGGNLDFKHVRSGERYPFSDGHFDVVVSFEVIEHIPDWSDYLRELARVLSDDGILILSSPNRPYYRDERGEINAYHVLEFDHAELDRILAVHFPHRRIFGQNHYSGILIEDYQGDQVKVDARDCLTGRELDNSHYLIAVCSRRPLPHIEGLCYPSIRGNQMRVRENQIAFLEAELERARLAYGALASQFEERGHWALSLQQQVETLKERLKEKPE